MSGAGAANPDAELVRRFVAGATGPGPVAAASSPLLVALGAELRAWDPEGRVLTLGFAPEPLFLQGAGAVQGGAVAAMLDCAMAFAGLALTGAGESLATTTLSAAFYAPVPAAALTARGRIDKPGRRVMFASAELLAAGRTVAAASSALLVLPAP